MKSPAPARLPAWMWAAAVVLMVAEFLLFDRMTSRHHAAFYPRWNDQIQYLSEAYKAYEQARMHGLLAGFQCTLGKNAPQGMLHDILALPIFWLAGAASRSAALSLNMLAFLAWQGAVLFTFPRLTGSRALGWAGFGLLLCLAWPWSGEAGSAVDFRLDHGAMCLLGITACAALLTDGLRRPGWTAVFGLATAVTLQERYLTGMYFAGIYLALAGWVLLGPERGARFRNLLLAGGVAAALALPAFWLNRTAIYTYYWVGHVTGAESNARAPGMDLWHSLRFVLGNLGGMHLGVCFGAVAAALTALLLVLWRRPQSEPRSARPDWLFTGLVFLAVPTLILSVHRLKSEFVLGALVPGVLLLLLWLWHRLWPRLSPDAVSSWRRHVPLLLATTAVLAGETYFIARQVREPHSEEFLDGASQVNQMADHIYDTAQREHITHPSIAVDQVVDFMDAQILQVICYERHKVWVPFVIQLPDSILADKDENILYRLKLCDFVLLTDLMPGNGYWPYDQQMRRLYPELKVWCNNHLNHVNSFDVFDRRMSLYQKAPVAR